MIPHFQYIRYDNYSKFRDFNENQEIYEKVVDRRSPVCVKPQEGKVGLKLIFLLPKRRFSKLFER